jgi:hypothetical protein
MKQRLLFYCTILAAVMPLFSQTTYYSLNSGTDAVNFQHWTQDPSGAFSLLPPSNFSNPLDKFIIDGESMVLGGHWTVAGTIKLENGGSLNTGGMIKAARLEVNSSISYFFAGGEINIDVDTFIIGPKGQVNTQVMQVNKLLSIAGHLMVAGGTISGAGDCVVEDSGKVTIINNSINTAGTGGVFSMTGKHRLSKRGQYIFDMNGNGYVTGTGLPDTVLNLSVNPSDNTTTTLSRSVTVMGEFAIRGPFGNGSSTGNVLFTGDTLRLNGDYIKKGSGALSFSKTTAVVILGDGPHVVSQPDTLPPPPDSIPLPPVPDSVHSISNLTVAHLVIDRQRGVRLNGDVTVSNKLTLKNGAVFTGTHGLQLGVSAYGTLVEGNGYVIGSFARVNDNKDKHDLLFPVGLPGNPMPLSISLNTVLPTLGLFRVRYEGTPFYASLAPVITDSGYILHQRSNAYWEVTTILLNGTSFDLRADARKFTGLPKPLMARIISSQSPFSQFGPAGHYADPIDSIISRSDIPVQPGVVRYYLGLNTADNPVTAVVHNASVTGFHLSQNYPNPFNPSTTIEYSLAVKSDVKISIYNLLGQKVATVVNETKEPGSYRAEWNASSTASGLYFYEMRARQKDGGQAGYFSIVKKMMLLK